MSDQIKTQHRAIGLLMAECEQLRRDLAQAKENNPRCETCCAELSECGKPNPDGTPSMDCRECQLSTALSDARYDLAQAKSENARLAAVCALAYEKLSWIREHVEFKDSMNVAILELGKAADSTVLRDLLAPTIELLAKLAEQDQMLCLGWQDDIQEELSHMRSILTSSAKSDTNTP